MAKYKRKEFKGEVHRNVSACARGGLRTGNYDYAAAPVTLIVMPGYAAPKPLSAEKREAIQKKHRMERRHSKRPPPSRLAKLRAQAQAGARREESGRAVHNLARRAARTELETLIEKTGLT